MVCYALGRTAKKTIKEGFPKPEPQVDPPRHRWAHRHLVYSHQDLAQLRAEGRSQGAPDNHLRHIHILTHPRSSPVSDQRMKTYLCLLRRKVTRSSRPSQSPISQSHCLLRDRHKGPLHGHGHGKTSLELRTQTIAYSLHVQSEPPEDRLKPCNLFMPRLVQSQHNQRRQRQLLVTTKRATHRLLSFVGSQRTWKKLVLWRPEGEGIQEIKELWEVAS